MPKTIKRVRKPLPPSLTPASAEAEMKRFTEATAELKRLEAELGAGDCYLARQLCRADSSLQGRAARRSRAPAALRTGQLQSPLCLRVRATTLRHGSIGFRQGQPQVLKSRTTTWAGLLQRFKELRLPFVRVKEEPDKQAIIAVRGDAVLMQQLSKLGVSVVQQETFFCEANEEHIAND